MDEKTIKEFKIKLEEEKKILEEELNKIGAPDKKLAGDFDTAFPQFGEHTSEQDENADEVEEYENILPVEHEMELHLKEINEALEKIASGKDYGICEKCKKEIPVERLKVDPEAKHCVECASRA